MRALCFYRFGGPDVLHLEELDSPKLAPGAAIIRTRAIGMNFADIYRRQGNYHLEGSPPYILGYEAAGVVEAVEPAASPDSSQPRFAPGDRVAFADVPHANAELVLAPLTHLVPLPDAIGFDVAAALLLQGLTAHYLIHDSYALKSGDVALVHAAAGGVGLLLVQLAKLSGATVIALASTEAKAAIARAAGADHALTYASGWVAAARALGRGGRGVDVVYDSVGSTLGGSIEAARIGGHVVFYGMAGGDPAPVDPRLLMDGSKTLTGGDLWNVLTSSAERVRRAGELFDLVASNKLRVSIARTFALADGRDAHAFLESRASSGKVLLDPA